MKLNSRTRANELFSDKKYNHSNNYLNIIIMCYNFVTPENVGSVIRLAANFGVKKVILLTDNPNMRESKIKKVAGAAYNCVEYNFYPIDEIQNLIPENYKLIAIETADNSIDIANYKIPNNSVLLLGNEKYGLPNHIIDLCHKTLHIPMHGNIKSMNVTHACAIALFQATIIN